METGKWLRNGHGQAQAEVGRQGLTPNQGGRKAATPEGRLPSESEQSSPALHPTTPSLFFPLRFFLKLKAIIIFKRRMFKVIIFITSKFIFLKIIFKIGFNHEINTDVKNENIFTVLLIRKLIRVLQSA